MHGVNEEHEANNTEPTKFYDVVIIGSGPAGYTVQYTLLALSSAR